MKIAIIGAGPTGLVMGIGLALRGHQVVAVDRDGGPAPDGSWPRKGVMQFHHAHGFRPQIIRILQREAPAAWENWLAAGGEPIQMPLLDGTLVQAGIRSRRATFEAAARAIPGLAAWTDPAVARPLTDVLPGGPLLNTYRGQRGAGGALALPGLIFVGDAVRTTTPNFGRGITTSYLQAGRLLELIDEHAMAGAGDADAVAVEFDDWCEQNMRPWVEDHRRMDDSLSRRWDGEDIDLTDRLPSDLIMAAASQDPSIAPAIVPYITMQGLPSCLDAVEPLARSVFETGWRPPFSQGPTRPELAAIASEALATAA